MIFLSHNYKDKDVVGPIAVSLANRYGKENVFYDSCSKSSFSCSLFSILFVSVFCINITS